MATSTFFNFNFNNSEIVDSTGQWYNATTGTVTTEFISHDGNTALFQPAKTNGNAVANPNPTIFRSYDPNFAAYAYTIEVQVCAIQGRIANNSPILWFKRNETDSSTPVGLYYSNPKLELWLSSDSAIRIALINFNTDGFDRWFSIRIERTVDPLNPYMGATVKAYVDGTEVYNQTFTYNSTTRGMIGPYLKYSDTSYATGGVAIDNLKLTAGIAPNSAVDVNLANLQRNNANLLSFIKSKVPTQDTTYSAGSNLSLSGTTFNVSDTPSFTSITIDGYTITID